MRIQALGDEEGGRDTGEEEAVGREGGLARWPVVSDGDPELRRPCAANGDCDPNLHPPYYYAPRSAFTQTPSPLRTHSFCDMQSLQSPPPRLAKGDCGGDSDSLFFLPQARKKLPTFTDPSYCQCVTRPEQNAQDLCGVDRIPKQIMVSEGTFRPNA